MITLTSTERKIYLDIRAEQIKEFQDRENGHLFIKPYSIDLARKIAENQLNNDLEAGNLRISLDDLLLLNNNTCIDILEQGVINKANKVKQST